MSGRVRVNFDMAIRNGLEQAVQGDAAGAATRRGPILQAGLRRLREALMRRFGGRIGGMFRRAGRRKP